MKNKNEKAPSKHWRGWMNRISAHQFIHTEQMSSVPVQQFKVSIQHLCSILVKTGTKDTKQRSDSLLLTLEQTEWFQAHPPPSYPRAV